MSTRLLPSPRLMATSGGLLVASGVATALLMGTGAQVFLAEFLVGLTVAVLGLVVLLTAWLSMRADAPVHRLITGADIVLLVLALVPNLFILYYDVSLLLNPPPPLFGESVERIWRDALVRSSASVCLYSLLLGGSVYQFATGGPILRIPRTPERPSSSGG